MRQKGAYSHAQNLWFFVSSANPNTFDQALPGLYLNWFNHTMEWRLITGPTFKECSFHTSACFQPIQR